MRTTKDFVSGPRIRLSRRSYKDIPLFIPADSATIAARPLTECARATLISPARSQIVSPKGGDLLCPRRQIHYFQTVPFLFFRLGRPPPHLPKTHSERPGGGRDKRLVSPESTAEKTVLQENLKIRPRNVHSDQVKDSDKYNTAMSPNIDLGLAGEARSVSGVGLSMWSAVGPQLHSKSLRLACAPSSRPHVHKTLLQLFILSYRTIF